MPNEKPEARANHAILSSVLAALLFAPSSAAQARIINAASPSLADVRSAIASAADGDTVIVPAGTASWTSCLTITKGITIQGQTTTDTVNGTANDQTNLVDNLVRVPGGQGYFNISNGARITGITWSNPNWRKCACSCRSLSFQAPESQSHGCGLGRQFRRGRSQLVR